MTDVLATMADNWVYWVVSIFAIIAAYIDGKDLIRHRIVHQKPIHGAKFGMLEGQHLDGGAHRHYQVPMLGRLAQGSWAGSASPS